MTQHFVFLLLGLGNGAVFAALALALVTTYRSSGVVNFATGAIALYAAYTYAYLRRGELLVPLPGLPKTLGVGGELAVVPALLVAVALAALIGVLLHLAVFWPLRAAPAVSKAVASLGVMIVLQALLAQRVGSNPVNVRSILPTTIVTIGSSNMRADRLWFAAVITAVALVLGAWFRYTRFGLATRAVADTEKGAVLSGLAPQRIAVANAALSAAVAGLGGVLIAPIVPLVPSSYTLFIVPALAAALLAGLRSLALAVGAALTIGMLQSELGFLATQHSWLPQHGIEATLPLVLLYAYLVVAGRPLPSRGVTLTRSLGRAPRPRHLVAWTGGAAAAGVVALLVLHGGARAALITTLIFVVLALSLVVVAGFAGQVSLAQLTLAGVAGFTLSRLTFNASVPFPVAPLLAASVAAGVGFLIGLPALRTRGLPVAVITLATAVGLESVWFNNPDFGNGLRGSPVPSPRLFGMDVGIGAGAGYPRLAFGLVCLTTAIGVAVAVARLRTSRLGAAMLAVRANERSAAAAGVDVARTKLLAFAIGGFIAGLGGSLLAYQQTLVSAPTVSALSGLGFFAIVSVAGITSVGGGVLAGLLVTGGIAAYELDNVVPVGDWYSVLAGVALVVAVLTHPEGVVGGLHQLAHRRRLRRALPAPSDRGSGRVETPARERAALRALSGRAVLDLHGVSVTYGGVSAVRRVSLRIDEGTIVGLIGPNGAGKTSLIDAVSGHTRASGAISFFGEPIADLRPHARSRRGLGRTFQGLDLYDDLSVTENIVVGETAARARRRSMDDDRSAAIDVCALLGLDDVRDVLVAELSHGQRQVVSIARALAGRPRVLLLDEPAGGLDSTESSWLGERLRRVRDAGVTLVLIDHDMGLVLDVCDEIHVLDLGELIASGSPAAIRADATVAAAYLGEEHLTAAGAE